MQDSDLQQKRLMAAAIDAAVGLGIAVAFWTIAGIIGGGAALADQGRGFMGFVPRIIGFVGAAIGLAYVLLRDSIVGGQSVGKKIMNLRVVLTSGQPMGLVDGVKRNALFAIGSALGFVSATLRLFPCLGDVLSCLLWPLYILGALATFAVVVIEVFNIIQEPNGVRLGDKMAYTRVTAA
jgi:uncharacterized RDD family membrane protein YckC